MVYGYWVYFGTTRGKEQVGEEFFKEVDFFRFKVGPCEILYFLWSKDEKREVLLPTGAVDLD